MVFTVSDKTLVVQSNRLIEAKYKLSVEEQKIIKILISQIQRDDDDFRDYEFRVKDLAEILGITHDNPYVILRTITRRLLTRVLEFSNPETNTLLQTSWLAGVLYKKGEGTVSLSFHPYLKPLLLQLQSYFTKYELGQIMQFKGQYTIRFFELRKSFLDRHKKTTDFTLKDLWEMLGLKKDEYKIFRDFKNRVLEPARIELLDKTGKSFSWESLKQGRGGRVVGVRFMFDGESNRPIDEAVENQEQPKKETKQLSLVTEEVRTLKGEAVAELVRVGVSPKTAKTLLEKHGPEYIQEKIELLSQKKDIKSGAGFVVSAIREDWRDEKVEKEKQVQAERRKKEDAEIRKKELRRIKNKYEEFKREIAFEQYQKLPKNIREEWKSEFIEGQPFLISNLLRLKGFDIGNGMFRAFVMQRLALPTFDDFMKKNGIQLNDIDKKLIIEI